MSTTQTEISWTDWTWNPVRGCSRVSPGCDHCYAEGVAARFSGPGLPFEGFAKRVHGQPHWTGKVALMNGKALTEPLRRRKPASIFVNSMSDLFHEGLDDEQIDRVFAVMALCPQHTFIVLTKRTVRAVEYIGGDYTPGRVADRIEALTIKLGIKGVVGPIPWGEPGDHWWPLPNVWLGASIEDQARADERAPDLLRLAALGWRTWVSYEPALGPVHWEWMFHDSTCAIAQEGPEDFCTCSEPREAHLEALVCGGESGPGARPMHPDWARAARDACYEANVPYHFKQWGAWAPGECAERAQTRTERVAILWNGRWEYSRITPAMGKILHRDDSPDVWRLGKAAAGRVLDGRTHDDLPWPVRPKKPRRGKGAA